MTQLDDETETPGKEGTLTCGALETPGPQNLTEGLARNSTMQASSFSAFGSPSGDSSAMPRLCPELSQRLCLQRAETAYVCSHPHWALGQ